MVKGKHTRISDEELVRRILVGGETSLFNVLYDRHAKRIFHKCVLLTKDVESSKDLTHDIMVKAFTKLDKLKFIKNFGFWLNTIAYNACMDHLRLRNKFRHEEYEESRYDMLSIDDIEAENRELKEMKLIQLEELFKQLSNEDKIILLMRYKDGFSVKEISKALSIGESAVKMRLKRSRDRLAELFDDYKMNLA